MTSFWGIGGKEGDNTIGPDSGWDMVEFVHGTSRILAMGTDWAADVVEVSTGSETVGREAMEAIGGITPSSSVRETKKSVTQCGVRLWVCPSGTIEKRNPSVGV